ncbi:MAG: hypothetical protein ABW069_15315, partial [Duganella sp.]
GGDGSNGTVAAAKAVPVFDPAPARARAAALRPALGRGALDDAALNALISSLAGAPAALGNQLAALQGAIDDFDFPLAASTLEALLDSLSKEN